MAVDHGSATSADVAPGVGHPSRSTFVVVTALLTAVAIAIRVVYVLAVGRHRPLGYDSVGYWFSGNALADGHGYANAATVFTGKYTATANFPPLYPAFLAAIHRAGIDTTTAARVISAIVAAATVPLTALLGRRIAGAWTGLVAAALVAVWPFLIAGDGSLMSETLAVPLVTAAVLLTIWACSGGTFRRWIPVGLVFGLAALARAEGPILLVCVVGAGVLALRGVPWRLRLGRAGAAVIAFLVICSPWIAYVARDFGWSSLWADDTAKVLAGANCKRMYYGGEIGLWSAECVPTSAQRSEAENSRAARTEAKRYIENHERRVPLVVAARLLRSAGLFNPGQQRAFESIESRSPTWQGFAWWCYIVALPFMVIGWAMLAWRRRPFAPVFGLFFAVALVTSVGYGNQRLRLVAEPALLIGLAAVITLPLPGLLARLEDRRAVRRGRPLLPAESAGAG